MKKKNSFEYYILFYFYVIGYVLINICWLLYRLLGIIILVENRFRLMCKKKK